MNLAPAESASHALKHRRTSAGAPNASESGSPDDSWRQLGFTLIELLAVVTIIGILAAIAIPQFKEYRSRAYDARAQSDLRNVATAEEAYYLDYEQYSSDPNSLPGFALSEGVQMLIPLANEDTWQGSSYHQQGSRTFCFNSETSSAIFRREGVGSSCS